MKKLILLFAILFTSYSFGQVFNPAQKSTIDSLRNRIIVAEDSLEQYDGRLIASDEAIEVLKTKQSTDSLAFLDSLSLRDDEIQLVDTKIGDSLAYYKGLIEDNEDEIQSVKTKIAVDSSNFITQFEKGMGLVFYVGYPQMNEYVDFDLPYDMIIDSISVSIGTNGGDDDSIAYNIWWDDNYINGIADSYLFSSTMWTDAINTGTSDKYYRTGLGTPVFTGNDTSISAGQKFWLQISTVTGSITKFTLTVYNSRVVSIE